MAKNRFEKFEGKKVLEKDIQREICEYLESEKVFFWRQNNVPIFGRNNAGKMTFRSMSKYTPKGLPDIMILHNGSFIGIEVKRDNTRKPSEEQIHIGAKFFINGGFYYVVSSRKEVEYILEVFSKFSPSIFP